MIRLSYIEQQMCLVDPNSTANKIKVIKAMRERTGGGIYECKQAVDAFYAGNNPEQSANENVGLTYNQIREVVKRVEDMFSSPLIAALYNNQEEATMRAMLKGVELLKEELLRNMDLPF